MTLDHTPDALASVCGRGPELDPRLYASDGAHVRIVRNAEGVCEPHTLPSVIAVKARRPTHNHGRRPWAASWLRIGEVGWADMQGRE